MYHLAIISNSNTARLFRDIVYERSISRAARANGITQSAASQQLLELERQLGIQLLDRQTRPLEPTQAGELYFTYCRDMLRHEEDFLKAVENLRTQKEAVVRIASIYSIGLQELPRFEREFAQRHPRIELKISFYRPESVYTSVLDDLADFGVVSYPEVRRGLKLVHGRNEPMSVIVPEAHELAECRSIQAKQLDRQPFIAFDDDLPIRREIDRYLRERGVSVNVKRSVDNNEALKACVIAGSGISIMPHCALDRLLAIPLKDPLLRPIGLVYRRGKALTSSAKMVIEELLASSPDTVRK